MDIFWGHYKTGLFLEVILCILRYFLRIAVNVFDVFFVGGVLKLTYVWGFA